MQRYIVKKLNDKFILEDSDFHHIKDVMRIKENENIICIFNKESYLCSFHYVLNSYNIEIIEKLKNDTELPKSIILYQAVIKNDKFDIVVQKSTELGVKEITPTIFSRSVVKIESVEKENKKLSRYEKIVKEACEQSHRNDVPIINNYIKVKEIKLDSDTLGLMAYENNGDYSSLSEVLKEISNYKKVAVIVGPEGGYSEDEVNYLMKIGFKSISLGKRILRSETASIYALSILGYELEGK